MNLRRQFLPMTRDEMSARGYRELDVLLVIGDAYFDHPSHGAAVIGRVLEREGYRVGIVAQPDRHGIEDFKRLGRPALFVGITAGAVDSRVNNYTASMAKRKIDVYSPGGIGGKRPDLATLVYAARAKEAFPGVPIILGGVEASLRRFAYVDSLSGKVRRSMLVDARADLLVYGAGEIPVIEIAHRLAAGRPLDNIPGTARLTRDESTFDAETDIVLPPYEQVQTEPRALLAQTVAVERAARPGAFERVRQRYPEGWVVSEPPPQTDTETLDRIFDLPFVREAHPSYDVPPPALEPVRWSVIATRGCPGGCSFCGLAAHQGREVRSRSSESILEELRRLSKMDRFRGTITDVGGPTANAYGLRRTRPEACRSCKRLSCLHPRICPHLQAPPDPLLDLLDRALSIDGIRHLFLASGIRHDLALKQPGFIEALAARHTGGHLKAAPEHASPDVLARMRKPPFELFEAFEARFLEASKRAGKEQYIVPYFIAGFPGCGPAEAKVLERLLAARRRTVEQCQCFIPLAGTSAAAMAHAGEDLDGRPLFVPGLKEARRQKEALVRKPDRKTKTKTSPKPKGRRRAHDAKSSSYPQGRGGGLGGGRRRGRRPGRR